MTDKELTEFAAKAIGLAIIFNPTKKRYFTTRKRERRFIPFDPLNLDGDALRLLVELKIEFQINNSIRVDYRTNDVPTIPLYEPIEHDACASARRAIVRAAAEIGKSL